MACEQFESWSEIPLDPQYRGLKRASRRIVVPLLVAFMAIYAGYVFSAIYAADTVASHHLGGMSVAWVLALAVNVLPIVIAVIHGLLADRHLGPRVDALKYRIDGTEAP